MTATLDLGPYPVLVAAKTQAEAAEQARDLIEKGYSIDVGLMQVNSRHQDRFHLLKRLGDPLPKLERYADATSKRGSAHHRH